MNFVPVVMILFLPQRCPHTLNRQGLNQAYNQRITSFQEFRRPLDIKPILRVDVAGLLNRLDVNHRGRVATLEDGRRCLNHKGPSFGHNSQTVVVDANQMSKKWTPYESPIQPGPRSSRLGDMVNKGGKDCSLWSSSCMHAVCRMKQRFQEGK